MSLAQNKTLRLILGDQLSDDVSSLSDIDRDKDVVLMAEVISEVTYVQHHPKKIVLCFAAMRHFKLRLEKKNINVHYTTIDDRHNSGSLLGEIKRLLKQDDFHQVVVSHPNEYRLYSEVQTWEKTLGISVDCRPDNRFLTSIDEFKNWADGKKTLRMEYFYRQIRNQTGLLMDGDQPVGGKWNFDKQNRKSLKDISTLSHPMQFKPDDITQDVIKIVAKKFSGHFGDCEPFWFAVTREQAQKSLRHFLTNNLASYGDYQDAMLNDQAFLFHSVISMYINIGLLDPLEVCRQAEQCYQAKKAPINAVEGFIRQIIGWREYIRGIYWLKMPQYQEQNYFSAERPLPDFYWGAPTKMHCLKQVVQMTKQEAYSHHIQRLMITGNFALLAGLSAKEVCEWYLAVYADAYDWVELPNTLGMALYADGGLLASKPYAASGAYINRMSDFCKHCAYNVKEKIADDACPFNYLYWAFLYKHRKLLSNNPRMTLVYKQMTKIDPNDMKKIKKQARTFLKSLS